MIRPLLVWLALISALFAAPETVMRDGVRYFIWRAEPGKVRVLWKDDAGKQLGDLPTAKAYLEGKGEKPLMLMNGGIFEPGRIPSGLMVQDGKPLRPLNPRDGAGNFFMKPNGIFLISGKGARVLETSKYPPQGEKVSYAVQSGPLLSENGKVHPAFNKGSDSRLLRNGVGVAEDGTVVFAISDSKGEKWPNLYGFADLFLSLGCKDALFLDGDISQMRFGENLGKGSNQFGSVIAVVEEVKSAE
ncbi:phosphodiester glycosidase family protein [Akkermansiaceae bacterium]|nr:phosphodiester glycosidase family protein [Akkermansiaceae bacterium]